MEGAGIRRRRKCQECEFRFSTLEELRLLDLVIVKRDGRREPYKRDKVEKGLLLALRKRSYTSESFAQLIRSIELALQKAKATEITSMNVGEIIMNELKDFDKVAFIRFASVYRQFEDVRTFEQELKALKE
jgi:transcriptional repressor NrdR